MPRKGVKARPGCMRVKSRLRLLETVLRSLPLFTERAGTQVAMGGGPYRRLVMSDARFQTTIRESHPKSGAICVIERRCLSEAGSGKVRTAPRKRAAENTDGLFTSVRG